jgi:hypothetical protein
MDASRLTPAQLHALVIHRDDVLHAEKLVRCIAPDQWRTANQARRLCDRIVSEYARYTTTEEVIRVFTGFFQSCSVLGPGAQDTIRSRLEPLIERLGMTEVVLRVAKPRPFLGQLVGLSQVVTHARISPTKEQMTTEDLVAFRAQILKALEVSSLESNNRVRDIQRKEERHAALLESDAKRTAKSEPTRAIDLAAVAVGIYGRLNMHNAAAHLLQWIANTQHAAGLSDLAADNLEKAGVKWLGVGDAFLACYAFESALKLTDTGDAAHVVQRKTSLVRALPLQGQLAAAFGLIEELADRVGRDNPKFAINLAKTQIMCYLTVQDWASAYTCCVALLDHIEKMTDVPANACPGNIFIADVSAMR